MWIREVARATPRAQWRERIGLLTMRCEGIRLRRVAKRVLRRHMHKCLLMRRVRVVVRRRRGHARRVATMARRPMPVPWRVGSWGRRRAMVAVRVVVIPGRHADGVVRRRASRLGASVAAGVISPRRAAARCLLLYHDATGGVPPGRGRTRLRRVSARRALPGLRCGVQRFDDVVFVVERLDLAPAVGAGGAVAAAAAACCGRVHRCAAAGGMPSSVTRREDLDHPLWTRTGTDRDNCTSSMRAVVSIGRGGHDDVRSGAKMRRGTHCLGATLMGKQMMDDETGTLTPAWMDQMCAECSRNPSLASAARRAKYVPLRRVTCVVAK